MFDILKTIIKYYLIFGLALPVLLFAFLYGMALFLDRFNIVDMDLDRGGMSVITIGIFPIAYIISALLLAGYFYKNRNAVPLETETKIEQFDTRERE